MAYENLCFNCFFEKPMNDRPCPRCGHYMNPNTLPKNCLMPGSVLKNRYVVGNPIGVGGFGITYKCLDTQIGGVCAIKEYLPSSIAGRTRPNKNVVVQDGSIENFNRMMKSFANEANLLKTLQHKNVISCYDSFFENNTAYFVMEYCDGINLRKYVNNFARKLEYNEGINILNQLMDGLEYIHSLNVLHRDLKPENIYITSKNVVKILDFGSARNELDQYMKELSKVVTVGYAPIEQYGGRGVQGHYTDIYALGATFYHLFTGKMPEESVQRVSDDRLVPLSALRPDLPVELKYAIEKCMVVSKTQRIQNISDLRQILKSSQPHQPPSPPPPPPPPPPPVPPVPPVPPPPVHTKKIVGYASLGQRVCANLIDGGIFGFIYLPFFIICTALGDVGGLLISLVFYPGYSFLVSSLMELWFGRTFGKMMLGQVVLDRSGKKAPAGHIFLRNLIKMIGVFLLCFAREGKLLHDFSTNSVVYIKK